MSLLKQFTNLPGVTKIADLLQAAKANNQRLVATNSSIHTTLPKLNIAAPSPAPSQSSTHYRINFAHAFISPKLDHHPVQNQNQLAMFTYMTQNPGSAWAHTSNGTYTSTANEAYEAYLRTHPQNNNDGKPITLLLISALPVKEYIDYTRPHRS